MLPTPCDNFLRCPLCTGHPRGRNFLKQTLPEERWPDWRGGARQPCTRAHAFGTTPPSKHLGLKSNEFEPGTDARVGNPDLSGESSGVGPSDYTFVALRRCGQARSPSITGSCSKARCQPCGRGAKWPLTCTTSRCPFNLAPNLQKGFGAACLTCYRQLVALFRYSGSKCSLS